MSGRKSSLPRYQIFTNSSMAADASSVPTNIQFIDNVAIQLNFTTSDAVGTFEVQVSEDYAQDSMGNPTNAGHWVDLVLSPTPVAASADDSIFIDLSQLAGLWIRTHYTAASGSGTLNGFISGKML